MDTGWVAYAMLLIVIVGVLLLFDLHKGPRPAAIAVLAVLAGVGSRSWVCSRAPTPTSTTA
ncbi:hypothetical protein ABZT17_19275 [Streptomyces sp. NPDC005648]|uniref:hypothetical protein n=1 Tax=Streptomyces sp. NPDC005648 TaxID=3157044 RepID=UPI0033BE9EE5